MRISVTGGNGFIGRATVDAALNAGHDAWSFDRTQGNDILGDLSGLRDADVVIHLAGMLGTSELFDTPEDAIHANVIGTLRILEWCRENDAGFVGITMLPVFPSVYTATKVCAQNLASAWHIAYGVPVSHVRAFNAYGPQQAFGEGHPQKIIPTFARAGWEHEPIPVWGDGSQMVDLVHSDDVAHMLVDATQFGDNEVFEAGTGVGVSVKEVAEFVVDRTGSTGGIQYLPMRLGESPTKVVANPLKVNEYEKISGWKPVFDWERVGQTVDWYADA